MNPHNSLTELKDELFRAGTVRDEAEAACNAASSSDELHAAFDAAVTSFWEVVDRIAAVPPASIADLRIKAYAFDWAARLTDDEPYHSPSEGELLIIKQIVAGLLDERIG